MPSRKLPTTDNGRLKAFQLAKNKADNTPKADLAFSKDTSDKLTDFLPIFNQEIGERGEALTAQSSATTEQDNAQTTIYNFISHFIQVFNFGIVRGIHSAADRASYGLDVNQEDLPTLNSQSDITLWGKNLINGEAKRLAAGAGTAIPMTNPSIEELKTAYDDFIAKVQAQSEKAGQYDKEQEDVEALRNDADSLVLDIWDEVEFTYRKDTASSKRRKAREYGVVYVSRPGEEPEEGVIAPDEAE